MFTLKNNGSFNQWLVLSVVLIAGTFAFATPAAEARVYCEKGKIEIVFFNDPDNPDPGIIGIKVRNQNGSVNWYSSQNADSVNNAALPRSLIQLAMTAYLSGAIVNVVTEDDCLVSIEDQWIDKWVGLVIGVEWDRPL